MRRFAAAAIVAVFLVVPLAAPAAADTADPGWMVIGNSASFVTDPIPRGALVSVYTEHVVSQDTEYHAFNPWTLSAPGGLTVIATCAEADDFISLPILYTGPAYGGTQINAYYPNNMGDEPFGRCANSGTSLIRVYPAAGRGPAIEAVVSTVTSHPGVFFVGTPSTPVGNHLDGDTGNATALHVCATNPQACPASTAGTPAALAVELTGAEWFICNSPASCAVSELLIELAPVTSSGVGTYVRQTLLSVERKSLGIERVTVRLQPGTPAGEYRLKVHFDGQPVIPAPLPVTLGQPI